MTDPMDIIPLDQLPSGIAESIDSPPEVPAVARPAATIVLMRPGEAGDLEVLLLRRNRKTGFVPGAYVFPGGRVDSSDGLEPLVDRLIGLTRDGCAERLDLPDSDPEAVAYYIAAIREAFEETGILVGQRRDSGMPAPSIDASEGLMSCWHELLEDESKFPEVLDQMGCVMDGRDIEYIAHWVTPVAEPRRYDTRFFAAAVEPTQRVVLNRNEMTDALWIPPKDALIRNREGSLPMVFPTIKTLEGLAPFRSPEEALADFSTREIPETLPRLVKTPTGIGLEI